MREQLQARLFALRQEFENGQVKLADLDQQRAYLRDTVLRISGAIQVLEEVLAQARLAEPGGEHAGTGEPARPKTSAA